MADEEAFGEDLAFKRGGEKQSYKFPEDMDGPDKKFDPRCNQCGKTAYKAEMVTYEMIPYHKNCFKCRKCKKKLTPAEANPFGATTYLCNVHYNQVALGGKISGDVASADTYSKPEQGPSLVTSHAGDKGDVDLSEGIAWRKAGVKQAYRYPEDTDGRPDPRCQFCGKKSYQAETVTYERIPYHKNCFKCKKCKRKLTPAEANPFGEDAFLCNVHYEQIAMGRSGAHTSGDVVSSSTPDVKATGPSLISGGTESKADETAIRAGLEWRKQGDKQSYKYPECGDGRPDPLCNKCGLKSYKAETVTYERIPYHKNCFRCVQCNKKLTTAEANPFGEDSYLCNTHFQQIALGRTGVGAETAVNAGSQVSDVAGPSTVGGAKKKRTRTSYKPKKRK